MSATLGRETELASAAASLSTGVRLLTVQGPPGVGDAHLARVVAARASKGAAAELTIERQGGAQAAMARLAASLGASSDATEVLARELARRDDPVLVVLRAERDREALAERLSDLLLAARPLRVVVASQQALGAPTERVLRLGPLAPDAARALFRREARGPAEQDEAAEICALVDHLPLGIVGAARWTSLLEPGELRERLRVDLSLLAGGPPGAPAAPTLLAAIDEALDALEPDVMEALAIVASAPRGLRAHVASSPVLVAAGRAAERSLLEVEHGLLRVPSLLARRVGERDPALRARAALRLAELLLAGAPATEARAREDAELLCVGARALLACPAPRSEEAAQLLGRAVRSRGGAYREIEELARRALEDTGLTGASRAAVGIARGRAEISLGAPREAEETLRSAEALARSLGEDELVAQATLEQAYLRYLEGRMPEARARYAEAMRAAPTARQRVAAQAGLAAVEWVAGDPEEAERLLALAASAGAEGGEAQLESSLRLAFLRWDRHDLDGAEALLVEVLDATDGAGLDGRRVRALGYLGNVARERGG